MPHRKFKPTFWATFLGAIAFAALLAFFPIATHAQAIATGTIEGRVINPVTGEYLENARITVEGTSLEAFTDQTGQYRLSNVPAGRTRVKAFYTGFPPQTTVIDVTAGQSAQQDISLLAAPGRASTTASDGTIKLTEFVVSTSKEMEGAAIAINEQRFSSKMVSVVATDEFGDVAEGNIGQFLKFIPGVNIDYNSGDARTLSMNGVPSNNVPVTLGGFNLASSHTSGAAGTDRTVELELISINNVSRIEVSYSPTPESPGMALAGSINLVPRGAFERTKPTFNGSAFLLLRDNDHSLKKTPGLREDHTRKIQPGYEFSYIVPVNKRFGFTLSANRSTQFAPLAFAQTVWRGSAAATNNFVRTGDLQLVDTTPGNPYLTDYILRDGMKFTTRTSTSATLDFKLTRNDRLTFSFTYANLDAPFHNRTMTFFANGVSAGNFGPIFTRGVTGLGSLQMVAQSQQKTGTNYMPSLTWRHDGPIWKFESGAGYSYANTHYRDIDKGNFNQTFARRTNVTVDFNDIFYLGPRSIAVRDGTTGAAVDPFNIDSYTFTSANSAPSNFIDVQRSAYANLRRDFDLHGIPFTLKGGLDVSRALRDSETGNTTTYNFVGADRVASTTPTAANSDDSARPIFDAHTYGRGTPFGFAPAQWPSPDKSWRLYQQHPEYFNIGTNNSIINTINGSKRAEELISSAYLRGDLAFLERRLKIVSGVRAEQTNVIGDGPLVDPTLNFQRDAAGNVIRVNGLPVPIDTDQVAITRRTRLSRGQHAEKEYLRFFPSINASYNLRENLVARGSYYYSVGRPSYNQYAGGLILPDTSLAPSTTNRIEITNPAIKAWSAKTVKLRLEYYFERVGQFSIGGFVRDIDDFFGNRVSKPTPELLEFYGLDPQSYAAYDVQIQQNLPGSVRMTGLEFDYKQALTFLPAWANGVQVFFNGSALRAAGEGSDNFAGFTPRTFNWGASLNRSKYILRANWNYRGRQRRGLVATGRGIEPGTYNWGSKRMQVDFSAEYKLTRRFSLFANVRNALDETSDFEISGPNTPEYAQFRSREENGALWTIGIKGGF